MVVTSTPGKVRPMDSTVLKLPLGDMAQSPMVNVIGLREVMFSYADPAQSAKKQASGSRLRVTEELSRVIFPEAVAS